MQNFDGIAPGVAAAITAAGIAPERVHTRYSDVQVMCKGYSEAIALKAAMPERTSATTFQTNPDHEDAKQYPVGLEIPFSYDDYLEDKPK